MQEIFAAWKRVMSNEMEKRVAGDAIGKPEGTSSAGNFGKVLVALGIERVHTRYGNRFRVVPVGA